MLTIAEASGMEQGAVGYARTGTVMAKATALEVAAYFLRRANEEGKVLTPMQVQKLVYLAHGWHLAITGEPLINEQVEAWQYGPVIPSLYHEYKKFGAQPITVASVHDFHPPDDLRPILEKVWEVYKDFTGSQLSAMTHKRGTPWRQVIAKYSGRSIPMGTDIPREDIEAHFRELTESR